MSSLLTIDISAPTARSGGGRCAAGPTMVSVSGEIDASNVAEIDSRIQSLFARRVNVLIDLTGVTFMGSCGLWAVVGLPQTSRSYGVGCAVVIGDAVDRLLRIVDHHRPAWVFGDLTSAMNALAAEGVWLAS
ncbi:STAS domain-containing protein [Tsukamurella soli]|uniref:STAS domain-containing protein n=1 Tax=Tsukamurella soli TaxID=644556 RepID=UPI0031E641E1